MSFLSQFFSGGGKNTDIGTYGVGLATGFSSQIPVDLMLIGGGGGGGSVKNTPYGPTFSNIPTMMADSYQGGGGGVGRVLVYNNCVVNTGVAYPITVGAGGAQNQRGGTSIFGILRSGGGGRGGGYNPDGTPQTPDVQDLWGGSEGGRSIANTLVPPPAITGFNVDFYRAQGFVQGTPGVSQGKEGRLFFSDQPISASFAGSGPTIFSPFFQVGYLTNASNIFKQAVNSAVFKSPTFSSESYVFPNGITGPTVSNAAGHGVTGASLPHYVKTGSLSPTLSFSVEQAYRNFFRADALPGTQIKDEYTMFPGNPISPGYPRSPLADTKDFIADFFSRAGIDSPITDGVGGAGGGGIRIIPGPYSSPLGNYTSATFNRVAPFVFYRDSPSFGFPPPPPAEYIPRNYDFSRTAIVSGPDWNIASTPNPTIAARFLIEPGALALATGTNLPQSTPTPIVLNDQTTKLVTWTANPLIDLPFAGGSPGNGGGGSGGNRVGPTIIQGTFSVPRSAPLGNTPTVVVPYALNIAGSPLSFASGGAGGSGSVWVIYPTDYAAATVVGNTPVPSPPAFRIYRWDGAGSITFNAS
jgi:hypothetical protein